MAKILRTKPNFLPLINGVAFALHEHGSVSEDVDQEVADAFLQHDGYKLLEAPAKQPAKGSKPKAAKTAAEPAPAAPETAVEPEPAATEDGPSF